MNGKSTQMFWLSAALLCAAQPAHAHIKLTKPASWIQESDQGDPQKSGPCGPPAGQGTETKMVTTFTEGEEITVEWTETVNHEGHFRIALAKDRSELKDPAITGACQSAAISDPPVYPILADGLFVRKANEDDGNRMFSQKVKLPIGMTCDNCTLQVLQFMTPHPAPCLYYHCANIKIVAAGAAGSGGSASLPVIAGSGSAGRASAGSGNSGNSGSSSPTGTSGKGSSGSNSATAGSSAVTAGKPASGSAGSTVGAAGSAPSSSKSGGCSAVAGQSAHGGLAWLLLAAGLIGWRRRR